MNMTNNTRFVPATEADIEAVSAQLGRPARGVLAVAARNAAGEPLVVMTAPRLEDGTPFPTLYYLTHPKLTAAASRLEAEGVMVELSDQLAEDEELSQRYHAAHHSYVAERSAIEDVPELRDISAGGMPTRVKCLHSLIAHSLAVGPGVNPIGDLVLARVDPSIL